jgi:NAD(P)-dependent dehydrogenase (short-subunit alcohol dehydrogenase family)
VVVVSSVGHINGDVLFDDINFEQHPCDPWAAYSQSNTANVLFMVEASKRWAPDHIAVNALNPGRITGTNLSATSATVPALPPRSNRIARRCHGRRQSRAQLRPCRSRRHHSSTASQ